MVPESVTSVFKKVIRLCVHLNQRPYLTWYEHYTLCYLAVKYIPQKKILRDSYHMKIKKFWIIITDF